MNKSDEDESSQRNFTSAQLMRFDGKSSDDKTIYMAINKIVFDVSDASDLYGPSSIYEHFAGHECGVAFAKRLFANAGDFLDDFNTLENGLDDKERMELKEQIKKFQYTSKYPIVGRLIPDSDLPDSNRILTLDDLANHKGSSDDGDDNRSIPPGFATQPIYVGAGDKVFDVSFGGSQFYGPGCSYEVFAGKNASRNLAKMSLEEEDSNSTISDLNEKEVKTLKDWMNTFENKKLYPVVGKLALNEEDEMTFTSGGK